MGHLAWDAPYRPRRALLRARAQQGPGPVPPVIASATVPARGPTVRRARAALSALSAAAAAASRPAPRSQKCLSWISTFFWASSVIKSSFLVFACQDVLCGCSGGCRGGAGGEVRGDAVAAG